MELGLKGKKAIVTGASRGLGRAIAESLASEGCDIAFCARGAEGVTKAVESLRAKGIQAYGTQLAVGNTDEYENWVKAAATLLGGLDIFVSNTSAGGAPGREGWQTHFDIDIMGCVRGVEAAAPSLEASKGNIIIINTTASIETFGQPGGYGAMKAALLNYANAISQQYAAKGIRVNSVSPGPTYFEGGPWAMIEKHMPPFFDSVMKQEPMGRMGSAPDIANAVTFLASGAAGFITGVNLVVDGGFTKRVNF